MIDDQQNHEAESSVGPEPPPVDSGWTPPAQAELPAAPPAAQYAPPPPPPPAQRPYVPLGYGYPPGAPPHWVAQVPPPQRRRSSAALTVIIVLALVFFGFMMMVAATYFLHGAGGGPTFGTDVVGVIAVEGVIRDGGEGGLFAGPPGARGIMKQIRAARKDDGIKAVIILINSPGGSAAASHAIYEEIVRLREKKQVVACMTDTAASGGYYIAAACDKIVAQGSTLTGSIGVIFGNIGYYGLMKKLGLSDETITAGKYKAMGRGTRPMSAEEKAIVVAMLDDIYTQFLTAVADGRKMDIAKVRQLAQGKVYTGAQAKKIGLVDELGNYYDAVKLAGKLGGIEGEPKLKYYGAPRGLFAELTGAEGSIGQLLRGSHWTDMPMHGPMLLLPYAVRVEPVLQITE